MAYHTEPRITLRPHSRRVRILDGDTLIADTRNAIELSERGYPRRHYIPKQDVDMRKLSISSTVTHCPFKGGATYYSQPEIDDVAWNYERQVDKMQAIARRLAFDDSKSTVMSTIDPERTFSYWNAYQQQLKMTVRKMILDRQLRKCFELRCSGLMDPDTSIAD